MVKKSYIEKPEFLSVPAAAELCGVSRNTLYSWVRQAKLRAYTTPGRTNLIRPSDLVHFMQKSGMFVPPGLIDMARRDAAFGKDDGVHESIDTPENSILIVDDEPAVRSVLVRTLDGLAPLYQAGTGYEALHMLTVRKDIRVVLLDINMPGQWGTETFEEIKKIRPDIRVVIITGFSPDVPEAVRKDEQVAAIYDKPVDIHDLHEKVSELFQSIT